MDLHDLIRQAVEAELKADRTREAVDRVLEHIRQFRQQLQEHFLLINPEKPASKPGVTQEQYRVN
jgi:hypothetical protein